MRIHKEFTKLLEYIAWIARKSKNFTGSIILIIFLNTISALSGVLVAILSKNVIDTAVAGILSRTVLFAALFGGIVIANLAVRALTSMMTARTQELLSNNMRQALFNRVVSTQWLELTRYHSGDVLTRLSSDVGNVAACVISTLPGIISLGFQLAAAFATLLVYEPALAFLAFILGPVTVLLSKILGKKLKDIHIKVQETESAYKSFIQEAIENILVVKTFCMENKSLEKISNLHTNRMHWVIRRNRTGVAAGTVLGFGYWAGYFSAFCWGAYKLSIGAATFGTLTAFLQLVQQVQGPFIGLSGTLPQVIAAIGSASRLMELEELPLEAAEVKKLPGCTALGIVFKDVTYSYQGNKPVLKKVSVSINPGEIVGLVGPSGEGKTTFIRVILSLVRPDAGEAAFVDLNGQRIGISAAAREYVSYVPQGNTLFSGTIAENLTAGWPGATREQMECALQASCALDFISELPEGLDTVIGEKGLGLSEGQAQRIAIARAMLKKSSVMILDEATSSLDINSERKVLQNIRDMQPGRTCIVITHRPGALSICSRIFKLKDGRLAEEFRKPDLTAVV
ncbi:ABC transporter ATP-binding protein [Ruminiclostridium cellobioparum]|uniref:ABC transporter ATP-binding protein n=1 Tax=Ruminiclostridium cellobioparum TaxID=29355 RepID=UPI00048A0EA5|nr:ABC transporter ATP-binding protein [Ruminiclostridium cellobioparum]